MVEFPVDTIGKTKRKKKNETVPFSPQHTYIHNNEKQSTYNTVLP